MSETRIGISGWRYTPWRGKFYPKDLPQKNELHFASRAFNTIELNGSFYSLQRPSSYQFWYEQTPADFVFAVKGSRYITHLLRLKGIDEALANFFASGVLSLRQKLGPFLWQFPPNLKWEKDRFESFFKKLPRDTNEALKLAKKHGDWLNKDRRWLKTQTNRRLRHAVEIRHESFRNESFIRLLRKYNVALVFADTAGKWPYIEDVTADFIYARLHGDEELYVSGYTDKALDWWADRFDHWRKGIEPADAKRVGPRAKLRKKGRDVYVYFDNDAKVKAPLDASGLAVRLGVTTKRVAVYSVRSKPRRDRPRPAWGN